MGCIAMAVCIIAFFPGRDGLFSQNGLLTQTHRTIQALKIMQMKNQDDRIHQGFLSIGKDSCYDMFDCTKDVNVTYFPLMDSNNGNYLGPSDWKFGPIWNPHGGHGTKNHLLFGWLGCNYLVPVCDGLAKGTNKNCILQSSICDGLMDCEDGSDEIPELCQSLKVSMIMDEINKIQIAWVEETKDYLQQDY